MIRQFEFNHFATNCYVVADQGECLVADPGMETAGEHEALRRYLAENHLVVKHVVLTHAHVDHIAGLAQTLGAFQVPVRMLEEGRKLLRQAPAYGSVMGFDVEAMDSLPVEPLHHLDKIKVGGIEIECRDVSGHCPGSLAFVIPSLKVVITGDALFCGSIGRTDLPGGDLDQLMRNIRENILVLDDDYAVLPGHGDCSTVGDERHNPFLFSE